LFTTLLSPTAVPSGSAKEVPVIVIVDAAAGDAPAKAITKVDKRKGKPLTMQLAP
jgi:phosphohistidine swiveling domain-containing protein